jgi:uncharacterized repeat protein (TIGR03943 family)
MSIGTGLARTVVLAAWAGLFIVLWMGDEGTRYLGPRTQWVIPFGAITLTFAAVAHGALAFARRREPTPLARGEAAGSLALFLPIVALLLVPQPELGAQAASKKRASNAVLVKQLPSSSPRRATLTRDGVADASFIDVAVASLSASEASKLGLAAGDRVRVHGLVVHESEIPRTFGLARFFISCCAADALPIVVPVDGGTGARPPEDQWLLVTGTLVPRGKSLVIDPLQTIRTKEPSSPYVSSDDDGAPPAQGPPLPPAKVAAPAPAQSPPASPPPTAARAKAGPKTGKAAGFKGRAARVYDAYYKHCKQFTYDALAWPQRARNETEAARLFAGPPREFQSPAFRGCLAGLNAGEATIDLKTLFVGRAESVG